MKSLSIRPELSGTGVLVVGGLALLAVVAGVVWWKWGGSLTHLVTADLNPASGENVVNKAASSVATAVTGKDNSVGTALYNFFHPFEENYSAVPSVPSSALNGGNEPAPLYEIP